MKYLASFFGFALSVTCALHAERVALVMGNNKYDNLPPQQQLESPVADATDMAVALQKLGYRVISNGAVTDASRERMITVIEEFTQRARNAEAAVFYFSGHGIQVGEEQFLIPSDTPPLTGYSVLTNRAVKMRESIMVALEEQQARAKVMILDCCRDNPFSAQLERALSQVGKSTRTKSLGEITGYGAGFYLAFATSPGTTANDGNGQRNSPFTAAMLKALPSSSGKDIDFFFRDVKAQLGNDQVSWTNHSLTDSFSLASTDLATAVTEASEMEKLRQELKELKKMQSSGPWVTEPLPEAKVPGPPVTTLPVDLPANGYFDSREVFKTGPYASYNSHSRTLILKQVQQKLASQDLYDGAIDGAQGPGTQKAINAWQATQGMTVTGRLDLPSVSALGLTNIREVVPKPQKTEVTSTGPASRPESSASSAQSSPGNPADNGGSRSTSVEDFLRRARELESR